METSDPPAVTPIQCFKNTDLPMLYKFGKFDYTGHLLEGVIYHHQHLTDIETDQDPFKVKRSTCTHIQNKPKN